MVKDDVEAQDLEELAPLFRSPPRPAGLVGVDKAGVRQDQSLDDHILGGGGGGGGGGVAYFTMEP